SFDQPAPVPEFAADNPYSVMPQPICDGTQAHANSLIPAKGADEDQTPAVESRRSHDKKRSRRPRSDKQARSRPAMSAECTDRRHATHFG
ncbi:hypothetical protein AnigIFM60653_001471, partial [Aspergillus niger]